MERSKDRVAYFTLIHLALYHIRYFTTMIQRNIMKCCRFQFLPIFSHLASWCDELGTRTGPVSFTTSKRRITHLCEEVRFLCPPCNPTIASLTKIQIWTVTIMHLLGKQSKIQRDIQREVRTNLHFQILKKIQLGTVLWRPTIQRIVYF